LISLALFSYQKFISNLIPDIKLRYTLPLISKLNNDVGALTKNSRNKVTTDLNQLTLKETILKKENGENNSEAKKVKNIKIAFITKQKVTDKVMISSPVANAILFTTKNKETVTIEIKPESALSSIQQQMKLTQSSKDKPQNIYDTKNIQGIYQTNLDRLFNEAELEEFLKNDYSKYFI